MAEKCKEALDEYNQALLDQKAYHTLCAEKNFHLSNQLAVLSGEIITKKEKLDKKNKELTEQLTQLVGFTYEELKESVGGSVFELEQEIKVLEGELLSAIDLHKGIESEKSANQQNMETLTKNTQNAEQRLKEETLKLIKTINAANKKSECTLYLSCALIGCSRKPQDFKNINVPEFFDEKEMKNFQMLADLLNLSICVIQVFDIPHFNMAKVRTIINPVKKISQFKREYVTLIIDDMENFITLKT